MRTIVLLPGMDGSEAMFGPLVEAAPADVKAMTVGYPPGHANSYEALLPRVQAALPRDRPFYLLGWSFSGPLALMAAHARPAQLRGVVLASSFVRRPIAFVPRWARHLVRPWVFKLSPAGVRARTLLGATPTARLTALLADAHAQAGDETLACRARAVLTVDASAALTACPVPVLCLRATEDALIPASRAEAIRRILPTVEIADLAGPHLALVTDPRASWSALRRFMDRIECAGDDPTATALSRDGRRPDGN